MSGLDIVSGMDIKGCSHDIRIFIYDNRILAECGFYCLYRKYAEFFIKDYKINQKGNQRDISEISDNWIFG